MSLSEITGRITPDDLAKCKTLLDESYTYNIQGIKVRYFNFYSFINSYLDSLSYQNEWRDQLETFDFRFQTFARLEIHVLTNHLSIISNFNNLEDMINECLSLGYSLKMAIDAAVVMRSVALRISYWDRLFYSIEYYIQRMNDKFSFIEDSSTHKKSQYFTKMLEFLGLDRSAISVKDLVKVFAMHCPEELNSLNKALSQSIPSKSICFSTFYEYAATLRNSLHNNGFSNKTLNNLNIGLAKFDNIVIRQSVNCMSLYHLLSLFVALSEVFQRITAKTLELYPGVVIPDPFIADMRAHLGQGDLSQS